MHTHIYAPPQCSNSTPQNGPSRADHLGLMHIWLTPEVQLEMSTAAASCFTLRQKTLGLLMQSNQVATAGLATNNVEEHFELWLYATA